MKFQKKISLEIYNSEKINEAIEDYNEISSISLSEDTISIEGENEVEAELIFKEFMNYVLSL